VRLVTGLETELRGFLPIIETVGGISGELRDIAKKTRMLGFNATIEATRGGEATRSFGVVADEIRRLAERADASAGSVGEKLSELDRQARILIGGVEANIEQGRNTGAHIDELRSSMDMISGLVDEFHHRSTAIADCTDDASRDVDILRAGLHRFGETAIEHARQLDHVRERVDGLEGFANDIFNSTAHAGIETRDSRYIRYGRQGAEEVVRTIAAALEAVDWTKAICSMSLMRRSRVATRCNISTASLPSRIAISGRYLMYTPRAILRLSVAALST